MQLITLAANTSDLHQFVLFWRALYQDPREHLYERHINAPSYVREYLPFHWQLQTQEVSARDLDKALWTFGKFLASPYGIALARTRG